MQRFPFGGNTSIFSGALSRRTFLRGASGAGAATLAARTRPLGATGGEEVSLCHATGNGSYRIISVSSSAAQAHIRHGDFEAFECGGELTCFSSLPLFCNSAVVCPTGAIEFCPGGLHDPTSSEQARVACEACFGADECAHNDLDCSGAGWLEDFAPQSEPTPGAPVFGYEMGICNADNPQPPGRVFFGTASDPTSDYGL